MVMEAFYINFIIAALFMIVSAILYIKDKELLAFIWGMVSASFLGYGIYLALVSLTNICYA